MIHFQERVESLAFNEVNFSADFFENFEKVRMRLFEQSLFENNFNLEL